MVRKLSLILAAMIFPVLSFAQDFDKSGENKREYTDELGYFQKANRDLSDPQFMFSDDKLKLDFGIGGTASVTGYFAFAGEVPTEAFRPGAIVVPNDYTPNFGLKISDCGIYAKARNRWRDHTIIAYVKVGGNDQEQIVLKEAYVSFDGLSIGKIPSFFTDLEVGVMTTGLGVNTQINKPHPLIGYRARIGKYCSAAIAIEDGKVDLGYLPSPSSPSSPGVYTNYQPVPDVAGNFKVRWEKGHVQLGLLARHLNYWSFIPPVDNGANGLSKHSFGYGFSLSGNWKITEKFKLSLQSVYGKGISSYLANLGTLNLDLGLAGFDRDGYREMEAIFSDGLYIGAQYDWTKNIQTSLLFGHSDVYETPNVTAANAMKFSNFATLNFFWYFNNFTYVGLEYLWGNKVNYPGNNRATDLGTASRVAIIATYQF